MNTITRHAVNITVFAATFFFTAFDAHAERATFNLPFEAHWGSVTLPPGKYTINVPLAVSWPQQITLTVKGKVLSISPLTEGVTTEPKGSYLQLVSLGGTYFVREFDSGSTGKQFTFRVPKSAARELGLKSEDASQGAR